MQAPIKDTDYWQEYILDAGIAACPSCDHLNYCGDTECWFCEFPFEDDDWDDDDEWEELPQNEFATLDDLPF